MEPPCEVGMKVYINGTGHMTKMAVMLIYVNKRTNGPSNDHLISWPSTKTSFAKFDVLQWVNVNSGSSFVELGYIMLNAKLSDTRTISSVREDVGGFYHKWAWRPTRLCDLDHLYKLSFPFPKDAPYEI